MFHVPNDKRIRAGRLASTEAHGNNGAFRYRPGSNRAGSSTRVFHMIASDGGGWEHVSVSLAGADRCPNWEEMCKVKALFWDEEDCVVQYHPPKSEYVNNHPYVLHLWRPRDGITPEGMAIPRPPTFMV